MSAAPYTAWQYGMSIYRRGRYATRTGWYERTGDLSLSLGPVYVQSIVARIASTAAPVGEMTMRVWDTKTGANAYTSPLSPVGSEDVLVVESGSLAAGDLYAWEPPLSESIYERVGDTATYVQNSCGLLFEQGLRIQLWDAAGGGTAVANALRLTVLMWSPRTDGGV